jgi:hypothetical protein
MLDAEALLVEGARDELLVVVLRIQCSYSKLRVEKIETYLC